nr:hypothetical protein [uncultured Caproiciproducens sp.]
MEDLQNYDFCIEWMNELLNSLGDNCSSEECAKLIKPCSACCLKRMEPIVEKYVGDLQGFIEYMGEECGQVITYDKEQQLIVVNENKSECVCAIAKCMQERNVSPTLCYCSANMTGAMISKIASKRAEARVVSSILRGDKTCVYEIKIFNDSK